MSQSKENSSMAELKKRLVELKEPSKPTFRRYKTNDTTVPKIHELLSSNPRGLLVLRDELIGLLASLDREDRQEDKSFYLEGWNGYGSFTFDRIGRGSIFVENVCLSIFGGIQPDKIKSYLYAAMRGNDDDGLLQRFQLLVFPDDTKWHYVDQSPDMDARDKANHTFDRLAEADFTTFGAEVGEHENIPYLRFSEEAQEFFKEWLTSLQCDKLCQKEEVVLLEHLSKYRSLMPSLDLIFHLVDAVNEHTAPEVSLEAAKKAAEWCDFLEQHARRIYGLVTNIRQRATISLKEKIEEGKLSNGFTARDVYQHGWSNLSTAEETQAALNELVQRNWLKEFPTERSVRYLINPKVLR